ncbi:MAG: hypothetical protein HQM00_02375 [Magnetococcales bacterium]|nr:hypothetical protein [Magnetococcales bacterium]
MLENADVPGAIREELDLHSWNAIRGYCKQRVQELVEVADMLAVRGFDVDDVSGVTGLARATKMLAEQFKDRTTVMDGDLRLDDC